MQNTAGNTSLALKSCKSEVIHDFHKVVLLFFFYSGLSIVAAGHLIRAL